MLRLNTLLIALCVATATFGCKKDEKKPPAAPGGNGFQSSNVGSGGDAGPKDSGGPVDASLSLDASTVTGECTNIDPGAYVNGSVTPDGTLLTGVSTPGDFMVTRALATWGVSCSSPTIMIELSDGKCPNGKPADRAHTLQILLSADAIDGTDPNKAPITVGQNVIQPDSETNGIEVQYIRPKDLMPHGRWGSCAGMPGSITFMSDPSTTRLSQLSGSFTFDLSVCDGNTNNSDEFVSGTFNLLLRRGREDVCPK